jgi:hypothetical protein
VSDMHVGNGYCRCGRKIESSGGSTPVNATYLNSRCIYAVCSHGVVVIDELAPEEVKP